MIIGQPKRRYTQQEIEVARQNLALEVQKGKHDGYAVRGTLTSSNAMRTGFNMGEGFIEAPDVIGINILGFRLPQLEHLYIPNQNERHGGGYPYASCKKSCCLELGKRS